MWSGKDSRNSGKNSRKSKHGFVRRVTYTAAVLHRRDVTRLTCLMLPQMARLVNSRRDRIRELNEKLECREQALTQARRLALP